MRQLGLIPARGGSKGIPRKNIKDFCGKPLIYWSIKAAQESVFINDIVVSTDDEEIAQVARLYGAKVPFLRPPELATDEAMSIDTILHAIEHIPNVDNVVLLQPTSPLRIAEDIDAVANMALAQGLSSVVSMCPLPKHPGHSFHVGEGGRMKSYLDVYETKRRQDLEKLYTPNGAVYFVTKRQLLEERVLISNHTFAYIMPPDRSIDLDSLLDWKLAEHLMRIAQ